MTILRVGDPHVRPDNLEESERLMQFVLDQATSSGVDRIEFLGDQHHTHGVLRVEVIEFWMRWAKKLGEKFDVVFLVGNHDQPGDYQREQELNALIYLEGIKGVTVASKPTLRDNILYVPHMSKQEDFVKALEGYQSKDITLVCHQTFNGCAYENGFYAKDGFDPATVAGFKAVICGHIHKQQKFGNISYIGTPRWDSVSDANEEKGIWIDDNFISTRGVCTPIISILLRPGDSVPDTLEGRVMVTLEGPQAWIASVSKELKGKARVIPKPTDARDKAAETSSKLDSIEAYAERHKFDPNVTPEEVLGYLKGMV